MKKSIALFEFLSLVFFAGFICADYDKIEPLTPSIEEILEEAKQCEQNKEHLTKERIERKVDKIIGIIDKELEEACQKYKKQKKQNFKYEYRFPLKYEFKEVVKRVVEIAQGRYRPYRVYLENVNKGFLGIEMKREREDYPDAEGWESSAKLISTGIITQMASFVAGFGYGPRRWSLVIEN